MNLDKQSFATFAISEKTPVTVNFIGFKAKKIFLDVSSDAFSFRIKVNKYNDNMLLHMYRQTSKHIEFPYGVESLTFSTTVETANNITLVVEEWGN